MYLIIIISTDAVLYIFQSLLKKRKRVKALLNVGLSYLVFQTFTEISVVGGEVLCILTQEQAQDKIFLKLNSFSLKFNH